MTANTQGVIQLVGSCIAVGGLLVTGCSSSVGRRARPGVLAEDAGEVLAGAEAELGFQAMEASFRALYPELDGRPLRKLVNQAEREAILPTNIAELARTSVELRNLYSHPRTQSVLTVGMAAPMLENTHRLVAIVLSAVK